MLYRLPPPFPPAPPPGAAAALAHLATLCLTPPRWPLSPYTTALRAAIVTHFLTPPTAAGALSRSPSLTATLTRLAAADGTGGNGSNDGSGDDNSGGSNGGGGSPAVLDVLAAARAELPANMGRMRGSGDADGDGAALADALLGVTAAVTRVLAADIDGWARWGVLRPTAPTSAPGRDGGGTHWFVDIPRGGGVGGPAILRPDRLPRCVPPSVASAIVEAGAAVASLPSNRRWGAAAVVAASAAVPDAAASDTDAAAAGLPRSLSTVTPGDTAVCPAAAAAAAAAARLWADATTDPSRTGGGVATAAAAYTAAAAAAALSPAALAAAAAALTDLARVALLGDGTIATPLFGGNATGEAADVAAALAAAADAGGLCQSPGSVAGWALVPAAAVPPVLAPLAVAAEDFWALAAGVRRARVELDAAWRLLAVGGRGEWRRRTTAAATAAYAFSAGGGGGGGGGASATATRTVSAETAEKSTARQSLLTGLALLRARLAPVVGGLDDALAVDVAAPAVARTASALRGRGGATAGSTGGRTSPATVPAVVAAAAASLVAGSWATGTGGARCRRRVAAVVSVALRLAATIRGVCGVGSLTLAAVEMDVAAARDEAAAVEEAVERV
ncbi:hypothetical protein MMPV_006776 [Pyropia vietnamensis]